MSDRKLPALVDKGEKFTRIKKSAERVIQKCAEPIVEYARRCRNGSSSIRVPGKSAVATVVWATRESWDVVKLTALRERIGSTFDRLFRTVVEFKPTEELEPFLKDGDATLKTVRKEIEAARELKESAPAVKFQS